MTIDYVEELLKLRKKIQNGEIDVDDVITDEMVATLRASGHVGALMNNGIASNKWVPATVLDTNGSWSVDNILKALEGGIKNG